MKYKFMDPDQIMNVVVALIVLGVGIFAFFITLSNIPLVKPSSALNGSTSLTNSTYNAVINVSQTGGSVFNIVGVVMIIGAIMTIVGLVYSYVRPGRY